MKTCQQIRTNTRPKSNGRKAQFKPEDTMQVVIFNPNVKFEADPDELCPYAALTKLPLSVFKRISQHVHKTGITLDEFLVQAAVEKISRDLDIANSATINQVMCLGGAQ